jgi:hypothetical protein
MPLTHTELVNLASKWLKRKCPVVITGLATTGETPDAIGWQGTFSILIECKTSLADFNKDKKKYFRYSPEQGLGGNRYFLTPEKLVSPNQLPLNWGLLEIINNQVILVKESEYFESNVKQEVKILLSTLRRIKGITPEGSSIKCYSHNTKNTSTVSIETEII